MLTKDNRMEIFKEFGGNETNTGSTAAQVALFTKRIAYLTEHMGEHKKDFHSRRGLLALVNKRRKLLDYLHRKNSEQYFALIKKLGLRK